MSKKELPTSKITRFEIVETVTLKKISDSRYNLMVIYGRKKGERARFKHQFKSKKYAEKMYDEMIQFKGMPMNEFVPNEKHKEISRRYEAFSFPHAAVSDK